MTASTYMPDVKVEIAFNAGYSTLPASRTWTDVSQYVELHEGITITHGRGDEFATAEPNRLTLTLDNSDGRFTAGYASGAYYPNVKIGRPIRVTATNNAVTYTRFVGYIEEWPVAWGGSTNYAAATITATSRMARLGFNAQLGNVVDAQNVIGGADYYWPLSEAEGSVRALNAMGTGPALTLQGDSGTLPTFGVASGLTSSPATAVTFTGGRYLGGSFPTALTTGTATGVLVELVASVNPAAIPDQGLVELVGNRSDPGYDTNSDNILIKVFPTTGTVSALCGGDDYSFPLSSAAGVSAGQPLHIAVRCYTSGGNKVGELYINGVLVDSDSGATAGADLLTDVWVGHAITGVGTATVGNVLINAPFATLADRVDATLTGFDDEVALDRIRRYAALALIPSAEVTGDAFSQPVDAFDTTGMTALDAMRRVEATEGGVLFDARDGTLTLDSRASRYNTTAALSLSAATQQVEANLTPKLDRSGLVNEVTATASDGSTQVARNATSITDYGYARDSQEVAASADQALQAASWAVFTHAEPAPRIPALGVDLLPLDNATRAILLSAGIGDKVTVTGLPAQAPASSLTFFIEGFTESIGAEAYAFELNVSPTTGYDVWVLEDATFGAYDTYPLAY